MNPADKFQIIILERAMTNFLSDPETSEWCRYHEGKSDDELYPPCTPEEIEGFLIASSMERKA